MRRHAILLALLALLCTTAGGSALAAGPTAQDAAKKKQTRAQKLKACTKKAKKKPTAAARRRAARSCRARFGPRKKTADPVDPKAGPETEPEPEPQAPIIDPVRDDAKFRAALVGNGLYRQYEVPKPNHGIGYNTHEDIYVFCATTMYHSYEGIAYIYKTSGPFEVVEGFVNGDKTRGHGTIRYTQATANFDQEIGKVQEIRIEWNGASGTVIHPEIGTYTFSVVPNAPCT